MYPVDNRGKCDQMEYMGTLRLLTDQRAERKWLWVLSLIGHLYQHPHSKAQRTLRKRRGKESGRQCGGVLWNAVFSAAVSGLRYLLHLHKANQHHSVPMRPHPCWGAVFIESCWGRGIHSTLWLWLLESCSCSSGSPTPTLMGNINSTQWVV